MTVTGGLPSPLRAVCLCLGCGKRSQGRKSVHLLVSPANSCCWFAASLQISCRQPCRSGYLVVTQAKFLQVHGVCMVIPNTVFVEFVQKETLLGCNLCSGSATVCTVCTMLSQVPNHRGRNARCLAMKKQPQMFTPDAIPH